MWLILLLALTLVPLIELTILLRIGGAIGAVPTLGLVVATGAAGAWLARREGIRSWKQVRRELAAGRIPAGELLQAQLVLLAGALLVTPGVLTDTTGLLLLVRPFREWVAGRMRNRLARRLRVVHLSSADAETGFGHSPGAETDFRPPEPGEPPSGERRPPRVIEI